MSDKKKKAGLFGNLLEKENFYVASTIVESLSTKRPQRANFYCSSPSMSWGSAVGYVPGMMELLYGPQHSGKTMIVLDRIKNILNADPTAIAVFVDAESTMGFESTVRWMIANGVDCDRVLLVEDEVCIKRIFEQRLMEDLQKEMIAGNVNCAYIAIDSIQALGTMHITDAQVLKSAGKNRIEYTKQDYGARANYLARILPYYRQFIRKYSIFNTFIGQARSAGEDNFGNPLWKTNGGEALYHEVQYRTLVEATPLSILSTDLDANGKQVKIGHRIKFTFEKNKAGEGLGRKGYCDVVYMKGIVNVEEEMTGLCAKMGIIDVSGNWLSYGDKRAQGVLKFAELLRADREIYLQLFQAVMARASTPLSTEQQAITPEQLGEIEDAPEEVTQ